MCCIAVQVLSNMAHTAPEVAASVWEKIFPWTLTQLAGRKIGAPLAICLLVLRGESMIAQGPQQVP